MRVIIVQTPEEMGRRAARLIAAEMRRKNIFILGLATGSTPLPLYRELIRMHREEGLDFSTTITFNLDEYVGLAPTHPQSYRYFMDKNLFDHVNVNKKNTHVPDGLAGDIEECCKRYEEMIEDVGGIDYQVLGIGRNGHIGFNEPGSSLNSLTRVKTLSRNTVEANARFFDRIDEVPTMAVTMGCGTILNARKVMVLASGESKADAVARALEGPVTAMVPASVLQLHRTGTYVVTEDTASKLTLTYEA